MEEYNNKLNDIVMDALKYKVPDFNPLYNHKNIYNDSNLWYSYIYLYKPNLNSKFILKNINYETKIINSKLFLYKGNISINSIIIDDKTYFLKIIIDNNYNSHFWINNIYVK